MDGTDDTYGQARGGDCWRRWSWSVGQTEARGRTDGMNGDNIEGMEGTARKEVRRSFVVQYGNLRGVKFVSPSHVSKPLGLILELGRRGKVFVFRPQPHNARSE